MSEPTKEEWAVLLPAFRKLKAEWEAGRKPVVITNAQHEALMAAADWIRVIHPLTGSDILDNLRAAGIELEDKT